MNILFVSAAGLGFGIYFHSGWLAVGILGLIGCLDSIVNQKA